MKKLHVLVSLAIGFSCSATCGQSPVDDVNPMIGTAEHGHVYPGATVPFGMVQLSPERAKAPGTDRRGITTPIIPSWDFRTIISRARAWVIWAMCF